MGTKLGRKTFPDGHTAEDFQCFGPPATEDGKFEGTMICDMGCFRQDMSDSNKFYHASVCQSKKNQKWFAYFEWGRTGIKNPDFQFIACSSKEEAEKEYAKQLHKKNDKRGVWVNHATLGKVLQAKPGKDCYLVRPQATRQTGLPDARTITMNDAAPTGSDTKAATGKKKTKKKKAGKKKVKWDPETLKLGIDLMGGATQYTRASMSDAALPTQGAIDRVRTVLDEAMNRIQKVGNEVDDQVNDKELKDLTAMVYGLIPKKKALKAKPEQWILNANNIALWQDDLQAYETALHAADLGDSMEQDPWAGLALDLRWLGPDDELGKWIREWMPTASRNRHYGVGNIKIKNAWEVRRHEEIERLDKAQEAIGKTSLGRVERPLHQPKERPDLTDQEKKVFARTNTMMGFHGTRSVNCGGILSTGLRFPKALKGVVVTGAMFSASNGIYWADDWKKSAGYTSLGSSYYASGGGTVKGRDAFMFVADVAIGKPFVAPRAYPYVGPPAGHHSIMGKAGVSGVQNNEFITFERETHRLRYLVEFSA